MKTKIELSLPTMGFIVFMVFLILKLTSVITWPWFWIWFPLWIPWAVLGGIIVISILVSIILVALGYK